MSTKSSATLDAPAPSTGPAALTVEEIDALDDRPVVDLAVPAWGGRIVRIQGLSYDLLAVARQQSFDKVKQTSNEDLLNAWCLVLGLVEPKIGLDVAKRWIMEKKFGAVNTILAAILDESGLGTRAIEAAKSAPEG